MSEKQPTGLHVPPLRPMVPHESMRGERARGDRLQRERDQMERLALDAQEALAAATADVLAAREAERAAHAEVTQLRLKLTEYGAFLDDAHELASVMSIDLEDARCIVSALVDAWDAATEGTHVGGKPVEDLREAVRASREWLVARDSRADPEEVTRG